VTRLQDVGRAAWHGFLGFYDSDDLTYAASIAFYALLALFPLFLLALALLGGLTADSGERATVLSFALRYFPAQFDFITGQLDRLRGSEATLGVTGTLVLIWAAQGVSNAITTAVNYAWGVEQRRSFWKHKLVSFLMLGVAGLMLVIALLLVSASQVVSARWFAGVLATFPGLIVLRGLTVRYATTLLFTVVVGLIYYFVPNTNVRLRDVWIGALLTGLLWNGALQILAWWFRDLAPLTAVDGSITASVVFLMWVYVQAAILLYGVEFTAAYAHLRREQQRRSVRP
jgi:membrane protein